jgi:hypothetical protein
VSHSGRTLIVTIGVAALLALVVCLFAVSWAQAPGAPGGPGPMGPGPGGTMPGMRMMQGMGAPAIAVAEGKVFVAAGGRLYRFNADTLQLEMQAEYAAMPPMAPPRGAGGQ